MLLVITFCLLHINSIAAMDLIEVEQIYQKILATEGEPMEKHATQDLINLIDSEYNTSTGHVKEQFKELHDKIKPFVRYYPGFETYRDKCNDHSLNQHLTYRKYINLTPLILPNLLDIHTECMLKFRNFFQPLKLQTLDSKLWIELKSLVHAEARERDLSFLLRENIEDVSRRAFKKLLDEYTHRGLKSKLDENFQQYLGISNERLHKMIRDMFGMLIPQHCSILSNVYSFLELWPNNFIGDDTERDLMDRLIVYCAIKDHASY